MTNAHGNTFPLVSNAEIGATLTLVFREEAGKVVGALLRILGNFEIAEEMVQDALSTPAYFCAGIILTPLIA